MAAVDVEAPEAAEAKRADKFQNFPIAQADKLVLGLVRFARMLDPGCQFQFFSSRGCFDLCNKPKSESLRYKLGAVDTIEFFDGVGHVGVYRVIGQGEYLADLDRGLALSCPAHHFEFANCEGRGRCLAFVAPDLFEHIERMQGDHADLVELDLGEARAGAIKAHDEALAFK